MGSRVTGLSGMDIEGMVSNLMKVETAKVDKLYKQRTSLTWKQEAYKSLASSFTAFQNKFLSFSSPATNMKSSSLFLLKNFKITSNGSESKAVTVKNTSMSKNVDHKLKIYALAQAEKMTGTPSSVQGYSKRIVSDEINLESLSDDMTLELNLDGKKIKATLGETTDSQGNISKGLTEAFADIGDDDAAKLTWVKNKLNEQFAAFGTATNVSGNKVNVRIDEGKLVYETEAGRALSVSSFNNNYTASTLYSYKAAETNDVLSFTIKGNDAAEDDDGYPITVDTFEKDKDGNYKLDSNGNKVKASAAELAKRLNTALNASGINGEEPGEDGKYKENFVVSASGSNLKFTAKSQTTKYTLQENSVSDNTLFSYDATKTDDVLNLKVAGSGGQTYDIEVDTFEKDSNGEYKLNSSGEKIKVSAKELAKRINDALNAKGINGEPDEDGKYAQNFSVSVSGNALKFNTKSEDTSYTIQQVDSGLDAHPGTISDGSAVELYGKSKSELGVASGASTDNTSAMTVSSVFGAADLSEITINGMSLADLEITGDTYISDMLKKVNDAKFEDGRKLGVTLSYSSISGSFTMESTKTGAANGFELSEEAMSAFGFDKASAVKVNAQDARFTIDGLETTRETNDITFGDLKFTLNEAAKTGEEPAEITLKSESDLDAVVKNIKDFINEYNSLLTSFTTSYTETRAKSGSYGYYEPLSDEEKSAMSDKDIELWETKAKQGLLTRDSALGKVIDQMRSAMTSPIKLADGTDFSLSQIGISSTSWQDMGVLTIDETKLRKALEERPDDVSALFSQSSSEGYYGNRQVRNAKNGLAYRLDDIVQDATRATPHPKTGSYGYFIELAGGKTAKITNNEMSTKLKEINQKIVDLEALNISKENRYYSMFSKMEQAMTKAQNQMSQAGLA